MVAAGSITVAVRVRPPTAWESARLPDPCYDTTIRCDGVLATPSKSVTSTAPLRDIVQVVDDRILTFDPDEKDKAKAFMERGFLPPGTKRYKDRRFMFDRVFSHEAQQQDVYEATARPLLEGLLDGYNATVFAYGATGCGKTHTISGTEVDPGIIYLTMADLFQRIEDRQDEWNTEVVVTFLEIYNEEIRDLLAEPGSPTPRGGLQIREDTSVKVVGLVELHPKSAEEVKEIVIQGNLRRTQSPTHANETSSRSHAVLQVHVSQTPRTASLSEQHTMATLSIIDLAGSERAAATTNMGQRMVEGANINKSLLALGNCINALCESGGAVRHIPYRNSKLTRLLKFSLGGNCKTVMIVCIAPTSQHFDDTHNTLIYAERATKIKTKVVTRNVVNVDRHVGRYVEAINRLNTEVAELKDKLAGKIKAEKEVAKRKKLEESAAVEKAKNDMQLKAEQTQASIAGGAECAGRIFVAQAKLRAIRARLAQIDAQASSSSSSLSSDLETERALLQSLAGQEEQSVKPDSALNVQLQRSNNSANMFDATLRAVSERRSEKLEELNVDSIKTEACMRKADMERLKAQTECDAVKKSVEAQAQMIVDLVGVLGRCTVMVREAGRQLTAAGGDGDRSAPGVITLITSALNSMADRNDEALSTLIQQSTKSVVPKNSSALPLDVFKAQLGSSSRAAPLSARELPVAKVSRRSSHSLVASPPRRAHKSPRKSIRSSLQGLPYRRASDKEKEKKKNVQWRDEAGQGELVDTGPSALPVISITSSDSNDSISGRNQSIGGSESEWEDDKTEDSVTLSFTSFPSRDPPPARTSIGLTSAARRSRPSRLDPGFLKSKASALGSLAEADENTSPLRRSSPLSDIGVNRLSMPGDVSTNSSMLHIPKVRDRNASPSRRVPSTPRIAGASSKSARRRSNIGPMRSDKARRRSSMIPQLSPPSGEPSDEAGPRRVETIGRSPAKRAKRLSLLANASRSMRIKSSPTLTMASIVYPMGDPNASISISTDMSMRTASSSRPSWR